MLAGQIVIRTMTPAGSAMQVSSRVWEALVFTDPEQPGAVLGREAFSSGRRGGEAEPALIHCGVEAA